MNTGGKIFLAIIATPVVLYVANSVQMRRLQADARVGLPAASALPAPKSPTEPRYSVQWQEKLLQYSDYATFVREALPAAEAGDADAQFALYTAFSICMEVSDERCAALAQQRSASSTEAARWLERAVQSNYPRALAESALLYIQKVRRSQLKPADTARKLSVARARLVLALRSNDPVITWTVAEALPALFPDEKGIERRYWTWKLAACKQGVDCGPNAPWLRRTCRSHNNCKDGESGQDYIRRVAGDFPAIHAQAHELAALIGSGDFRDEDFDAAQPGR